MKMSHTWKLIAAICILFAVCAANDQAIAVAPRNGAPSQDTSRTDKRDAAKPDQAAKKGDDSKPATPDASPKSDVTPLKKLTVRVRDPDGKPVAGAHVGLSAHWGTADEPKKPADTD